MSENNVTLILVGGLWLDGSIWTETAAELTHRGHTPVALTLPGQGGAADATLDDQLGTVLDAIDAVGPADSPASPVLVGHSAACTLVWMAADRRPDVVRRVVMIGGFPGANGSAYADFFEIKDGVMPFPGWEPFDGADSADLEDATRRRIADNAIAVPEAVATGVVELRDKRRFDVPVTLLCPEFSPDEAKAWVKEGELPELANARDVSYVDIDSGHWPMVSRPADLARLLDEIATEKGAR
jgi:pimeloyl-ACP methyl ester carboxylesterase